MGNAVPPERRRKVVALPAEVGITKAARESGHDDASIRRWAQSAGSGTNVYGGRRGQAERRQERERRAKAKPRGRPKGPPLADGAEGDRTS